MTRSEAADQPLDVGVTLSSGIISARKLRYTVTIAAGEATGALAVPTDDPAPDAVTGDVTATVDTSKRRTTSVTRRRASVPSTCGRPAGDGELQ